ncbi:MAG: amidohydrolase family protein [Streptosporangiales bacterium]|nr:amidohydrolase family protein [Streptosporangiales bacterium]
MAKAEAERGRHGDTPCDLVLSGARVIDPETGIDGVRDVAVRDGMIVAVTEPPEPAPAAATVIDVSGLVLAPGFIDLHSHAQSRTGLRLQSLDGVTTSLDLEAGTLPFTETVRRATEQGRPINFGYAAHWALARMHLFDGLPLDAGPFAWGDNSHLPMWRRPADRAGVDRLVALLEGELAAGALGVGMLVGYAPDSGRAEYFEVAALAARMGVPTFTHTRYISKEEPHTSFEGAAEVVAAAAGTGAHMHMCHMNSTSNFMVDEIARMVEGAQRMGVRVTTEAYPYGSGSTVLGASFLTPEGLARLGAGPSSVHLLSRDERPATAERLLELREEDPGALVILDWLDENDPEQLEVLKRSLLFPDAAIASDSMWVTTSDGRPVTDEWPVPPDGTTHPRSAGCFAKTLRWLVRELRVLTLPETIRRCTLLPAQILAEAAPAMARKGRVQPGCDADLTIFDPDTVTDRATFTDPAVPSAGFHHVIVDGTFVVRDGKPVLDALPGRPILSHHATQGA